MQTEVRTSILSPYVNLSTETHAILRELVDAGTAYYIVARQYPGILSDAVVLDNLHFTRASMNESWRLEWGGTR